MSDHPPENLPSYRLLTGPDDASFCRRAPARQASACPVSLQLTDIRRQPPKNTAANDPGAHGLSNL